MPDLVRRQVFLDRAGLAVEAAPNSVSGTFKVLALPVRLDVAGRAWAELLRIVSENPALRPINFHIADYLPDYARKLTSDLETALSEGKCVFLWAGDNQLRLAGYPLLDGPRWTDTDRWYRTAADAFAHLNPLAMEDIP